MLARKKKSIFQFPWYFLFSYFWLPFFLSFFPWVLANDFYVLRPWLLEFKKQLNSTNAITIQNGIQVEELPFLDILGNKIHKYKNRDRHILQKYRWTNKKHCVYVFDFVCYLYYFIFCTKNFIIIILVIDGKDDV